MIKNDFSIHLMKNERKGDAIHELKKTLLSNEDNALLYKNYAAILAKAGNFSSYIHGMYAYINVHYTFISVLLISHACFYIYIKA